MKYCEAVLLRYCRRFESPSGGVYSRCITSNRKQRTVELLIDTLPLVVVEVVKHGQRIPWKVEMSATSSVFAWREGIVTAKQKKLGACDSFKKKKLIYILRTDSFAW